MKIAQLAPLAESVPPRLYGGTERIISYLTEELVRAGHNVTLFATEDSRTRGRLHAVWSRGLRAEPVAIPQAPVIRQLERVFSSAHEFDVIHSHLDFLAFPLARRSATPVLTTLHGRLDLPELAPVFGEYAEMPLVSISHSQRAPLPRASWWGTIYHGLPPALYPFNPHPGRYLAFLGRIAPEKCPDRAIAIATRVGMPLRIAAKVDPVDRDYFETRIRPLLAHPLIEYVGELDDVEKADFLGDACALLAPFDWPEPFGLVFIEALACGTPVVAYRCGSVPELIEDGVTGFICRTRDEMMRALPRLGELDRLRCRQAFEARFSVDRMAREYMALYEALASEGRERLRVA